MAHLKARSNYPTLLNRFIGNFSCITSRKHTYNLKYCGENGKKEKSIWERKRWVALLPCNSTERIVGIVEESKESEVTDAEGLFGNLVTEFGWRVRRLVEEEDEMRNVAQVQAEAFHIPVVFFNNLFLEFFKAEVLAALLYKIRNSPPNRYACLVAEPTHSSDSDPLVHQRLVGVVDITVSTDKDVLDHLEGAEEYLYVSGIAVLNKFRRQKVATVLLKACDLLSLLWGFDYLALRAYEDDSAARKLYTNAGYRVVSGDPVWMTTWIGKKRRILMIKQSSLCVSLVK